MLRIAMLAISTTCSAALELPHARFPTSALPAPARATIAMRDGAQGDSKWERRPDDSILEELAKKVSSKKEQWFSRQVSRHGNDERTATLPPALPLATLYHVRLPRPRTTNGHTTCRKRRSRLGTSAMSQAWTVSGLPSTRDAISTRSKTRRGRRRGQHGWQQRRRQKQQGKRTMAPSQLAPGTMRPVIDASCVAVLTRRSD